MEESAHLTWRDGHHWEAQVRDHALHTDKPEAKGGTDRGPMSSEVFLVALGSCMANVTRQVAERRRLRVEAMEADVGCDFDDRGMVTRIEVEIRVTTPDPGDDWATVARLVPGICTISDLTAKPVDERLVVNGGEPIPMGRREAP